MISVSPDIIAKYCKVEPPKPKRERKKQRWTTEAARLASLAYKRKIREAFKAQGLTSKGKPFKKRSPNGTRKNYRPKCTAANRHSWSVLTCVLCGAKRYSPC